MIIVQADDLRYFVGDGAAFQTLLRKRLIRSRTALLPIVSGYLLDFGINTHKCAPNLDLAQVLEVLWLGSRQGAVICNNILEHSRRNFNDDEYR